MTAMFLQPRRRHGTICPLEQQNPETRRLTRAGSASILRAVAAVKHPTMPTIRAAFQITFDEVRAPTI